MSYLFTYTCFHIRLKEFGLPKTHKTAKNTQMFEARRPTAGAIPSSAVATSEHACLA